MGMYTEVFFAAELKELPADVSNLLYEMQGADWETAQQTAEGLDDPFFKLPRWQSVFCGSSAYFEAPGRVEYGSSDWGKYCFLRIHSSLKDYKDEADAFFRWIAQYVNPSYIGGGFVGYTLYEEAEVPTLYFIDHDNTVRTLTPTA